MKVDTSRKETLHVTFNLTFPALPCEALLLDAGDVSGKWQTESRLQLARQVAGDKRNVQRCGRQWAQREQERGARAADVKLLWGNYVTTVRATRERRPP